MSVQTARTIGALALAALGAFIWLRQGGLPMTMADALPLFASPVFFFSLGGPWVWRAESEARPAHSVNTPILATLLLAAGLAVDLTLPMAAAWTLFFWIWIRHFALPHPAIDRRRLLVLPILAFPWLFTDLHTLGWWFRLSGAGVSAWLFSSAGFGVEQEGTRLLVQGVPLTVDEACAGLGTLQAMLVAGSLPAFHYLGRSPLYWPAILSLVPLAWLANCLRILLLGTAALTFGSDAARGWLHGWGGVAVIALAFLLAVAAFSSLSPKPRKAAT